MKKEELRRLLEHVEGMTQKLERELADSVLEVNVRANQEIVDELKDERMCQALLEIMEPEINKIVKKAAEQAAEQARKEQAMNMAKKMVDSGKFTIEEILNYVSELSTEEVRAIVKA